MFASRLIRCKKGTLFLVPILIVYFLLVRPPIFHSTSKIVCTCPIATGRVCPLHREVIQNTPPVVDTAVEVDVQLIDDVRGNGVAYFRLAIRLLCRFFTI